MIQLLFPSLHESLIIIGRECGHELIASEAHAGVAVSNISKTSISTFGKLDLQPTCRDSGHDSQHLHKPSLRLVTSDIPNRFSDFIRRDENAIALGNSGGTDDKLRRPTVRPFRLSHRAQKWKHSHSRCVQSLPVGMRCAIWLGDAHTA